MLTPPELELLLDAFEAGHVDRAGLIRALHGLPIERDAGGPLGDQARDLDTALDLTLAPSESDTGGVEALSGYAELGLDPERFAARYIAGPELGRGGAGRVMMAHDALVGRSVAVKTLLTRRASTVRRFITEARITAQLEHPNVVPVYDFGVQLDGSPWFSMKRVRGRSLRSVLDALEAGDPAIGAAFSRYRLLRVLIAVGQAVDYAHAKGVIHRDLKPENIMVGDFGEVLVMDWGVARVLGEVPHDAAEGGEATEAVCLPDSAHSTMAGSIVGTAGYMPPEQARGEHQRLDARADVWALGAILYEVLTGAAPFRSEKSALSMLVATASREVPPAREAAPHRAVPADLEAICARALARDPARRHPSARALCDDIEAFLTGALDRTRRLEEAEQSLRDGEESLWYMRMLREELEALRARLDAWPALTGQEPLEDKRARWAAEDRAADLERELRQAFGWAEGRFVRAVELIPDHEAARDHLADMHWRRYRGARDAQDRGLADEHLKAVARHRPGDPRLRGPVHLTLRSDPAGARASLSRVVEKDRVLIRTAERDLGQTPLEVAVPTGRSVIELRLPDRRPVFVPVMIWQGDTPTLTVEIPSTEQLGDDFVFVPGGRFVRGTDPEALLPRPSGMVDVPAFAIGRTPITCAQYFEFLNALPGDEAARRAPRATGQGVIVPAGPDGWRFPIVDMDGDAWDPDWPIFNVSHDDAEAYAAWRSARDGVPYRLPREDEWEKAARGTDGRVFPWGDHFDPTFCRMRTSLPGDLMPKPVGSFPTDTSPYGALDMAGGVREWVDGWFERGLRAVRGGAFNHYAFFCRAASRFGYSPHTTIAGLGFRLVKTLSPAAGA